ncbi:MAG: TatD family hydrolase, partial [Muribaculaceae bacterium]|nr:TatD family hydrolase [Muribaculaceae bacterium]
MHSFTGTTAEVESLRQYGDFYFGINGIVTFKRSEVPLLLPVVGLNRILLETDSPYLAPVPHRGKRNESSFLPHIAACIANHLGTTTTDVEEATTANAKQLFKLI